MDTLILYFGDIWLSLKIVISLFGLIMLTCGEGKLVKITGIVIVAVGVLFPSEQTIKMLRYGNADIGMYIDKTLTVHRLDK